jgi:hypothetical protein
MNYISVFFYTFAAISMFISFRQDETIKDY